MAPTIHFVRHAQGFHNLSLENEQLPDPDLTDLGHQQCRDLHASFPYHSEITALLASPIRRTLNTALESFTPQQSLAPGIAAATEESITSNELLPVIAIDTLQEVSNSPCDTGSEPEALREEFGARVDLGRVRKGWNDKRNSESWAEPRIEKLIARAKEARRVIREIAMGKGEDGHVVVVTHGAIVHYLTDEWDGIPEGRATSWSNCEYRSYQFVDTTGQDEEAALEETQESWEKRTGGKDRLNHAEARALRDVMQKRLDPQAQAEVEVQA